MKKDSDFWDHKPKRNNKYILGGLLFVIIFIGLGSFAYAKFYNKPNTQSKQIPIQISGDSATKNEDTVSQAPPTNEQIQQVPDNNAPSSTTMPAHNQTAEIKPAIDSKSITTTPVNDYEAKVAQINQKILDDNKKAEEEYAQEQAARQARIQYCDSSNKQRGAILDPIKKQINDLWLYYINIPDAISQKTKGSRINQTQLDNMIVAEQNKTQTEINNLQLQLNQLSDQYPVCNY